MQSTLTQVWKTSVVSSLAVLDYSFDTVLITFKMVKTKMTPHRSDASGKLPPLAPARRPKSDWGTATKTFITKFKLPMHPHVQGALDYRSKSKVSKLMYIFDSTVLNICMKCRMSKRSKYLHMLILVPDLTIANPAHGKFYKPKPGDQIIPPPQGKKRSVKEHRQPAKRTKKWRPATQALREVYNLMRTTNLCISWLPFMWYSNCNYKCRNIYRLRMSYSLVLMSKRSKYMYI